MIAKETVDPEAKRKLAVVTAVDGTIQRLLLAQIKAAQEMGYEVHGICAKGSHFGSLADNEVLMYPVTIKRKISPFSDLVALWKMYRYFRLNRIDIVHTHTPKCSLLGQLAAKLAGVPVIINTVHGFYFHDNMPKFKRYFYIAMEWIAARCSTCILSQNPEDVDTATRLRICSRNRIKELGNGVDLDKFEPARFQPLFRIKKRKELGIPSEAIVIGIIARLVKEKGLLDLFEAFRNILAHKDNVWLVVIGPEDNIKSDRISQDTFKEFHIEHRTIWLGKRDDIPELLCCMDIYCLPSWREGFPRSAIEAAAMGLPVITTDIRGCRQVVQHGVNGLLVPFKKPVELEAAIARLIEDAQLRRKLGSAGYHKARREFDERKICKTVLDTYEAYWNPSASETVSSASGVRR